MGFDPDAFIASTAPKRGKAAAPVVPAGATPPPFDPDAFARSANPADAGPGARRAAAGKPPEPAAPSDTDLGIVTDRGTNVPLSQSERAAGVDPGMIQVDPKGKPLPGEVGGAAYRPLDPMEADPIAAGVAAGVVGSGAAALVPAIAAAPVLGTAIKGAVAGGVTTGVAGGSPSDIAKGAALGAALPLAGAIAKGAAGRINERFFKDLGRTASAADRVELTKLGEPKVNEILDAHGIREAPDPLAAGQAAETAKAKVESELRAVLDQQAKAAEAALPPAERLYRQAGQMAGKVGKGKIEQLGKEVVTGAYQRAGVTTLENPAAAISAGKAAEAQLGKQIGGAYDAIDATGTRSTVGETMEAMEELRKELAGNTSTKPLAETLHKFMKDFWDTNGGKATAPITAKQLNTEIGKLEATGYAGAGASLSPGAGKQLARQTARALNGVLDRQLETAAQKSPLASEAVTNLDKWNQDYRVFKTINPLISERAAAQRFAPPAAAPAVEPIDKHLEALAATGAKDKVTEYRTLKIAADAFYKAASDKTMQPPLLERFARQPVRTMAAGARAAAIPVRAIDSMLARLYTAPVVTPELLQEAQAAGVPATTISAIASMRKARAAQLTPAVAQ